MAEITPLQSPAQALAQVGGAINAINQNRLFQGRLAAGQALQQATDPDTGQVDPLKYNKLLALDPNAAAAMQEAGDQSQLLQGQQQTLQTNRAGAMNSALSSALALPDDQLHAGTNAALQRLVVQQIVPPFQAAAMSQRLDSIPDPGALRSQLKQVQLGLMSPEQRQTQLYGASSTVDNGGYNIPAVTQSPMNGGGRSIAPGAIQQTPGPQFINNGQRAIPTSGGQPIGSGIQQVTGPETNAALVDVYQPDPNNPGQFIRTKVPRGNLPGASGVTTAAMPSAINPPAGPNPMGTGRGAPSAGAASPGQSAGGIPQPAASPSQPAAGPILAEPPQSVAAGNSADITNFQQAKTAIPAVNNTMQNLQHAYDALQTVGTGPSTESMQRMKSFLVARGIPLPQGIDDSVKNYDLFRKYTEKYALDQASGSNTDAGRAMMAASNAGTGISTAANNDVLRNEIGKQRLAIATVDLAPNQTGIGYGTHAANLSSQVDPRGFSIDMYSPAEVQKMVSAMPNDAARTRFFKAAGMATRLGMVSPRPGAAPAQTAAPPVAPGPRFAPQIPTSD